MSPALAGGFLIIAPPGKPRIFKRRERKIFSGNSDFVFIFSLSLDKWVAG